MLRQQPLNLKKLTQNNRIHYLKWGSTVEDISIRFYFTFQTRAQLEQKYVLKNHSTGEYVETSEEVALFLISNFCSNKVQEVVGYSKTNNNYMKNIFHGGNIIQTTEKHGKVIGYGMFQKVTLDL